MKEKSMTNVSVLAAKTFPDDARLKVQKQVSNDNSATWADDGSAIELSPGDRISIGVSLSVRFYVSSETPYEMGGELRSGQSNQLRVVKEGWNGQAWYDHQVFESPESPMTMLGLVADMFRYRVEQR